MRPRARITLAADAVSRVGAVDLSVAVRHPRSGRRRRALKSLEAGSILAPDEIAGAKKVLDGAALTYVAAFLTSLLTLQYWAYRLGLLGGRRRD